MSEFLDMGGYAAYVWPSYAVTFVVIALNIFWARRAARAGARGGAPPPRRAGERLVTPTRRRRLLLVLGIVAGVSIAGALALNAFRRNVTFFFDPTQVAAARWRPGRRSASAAW